MADVPSLKLFLEFATQNDVEDLLGKLREHDIEPVHSLFATIHHKSDARPDGFSGDDLDEIAGQLNDQDKATWTKALADHLDNCTGH